MSIVAIVPARKGSERLPGKNRLEIGNLELWERAALIAAQTPSVDEVIVSTDYDDLDPITEGQAPIIIAERPAHLCTATAPIEAVIAYHLRDEHELIVLLNPTSPFRSIATVEAGISAALSWRNGCAVSVVPRRDPHLDVVLSDAGLLVGVPVPGWRRSQDVEPAYRMHGAVFVTRPQHIRRGALLAHPCVAVITSEYEVADIDTEEDYAAAVLLHDARSGDAEG